MRPVFLFLTVLVAAAQSSFCDERPKVGLVLSGGGALGFAHIGVIKVLEQNRIPVDLITGTSMGSIVGAAYASGASVKEMEEMASSTDWNALFSESIPREDIPLRFKPGRNRELFGNAKLGLGEKGIIVPAGIIEGQNVLPLFQRLYARAPSPADFDDLPLPFRAVTADIETGKAVIPNRGDLATVVRASMSVPGVFSPVEIDNRLLVDGGIVDNFPITLARSMGAEIVIAVDLAGGFRKKEELTGPLSIGGQILSFLLEQNSAIQRSTLEPKDVYILADTTRYTPTSFGDGSKILQKGEEAAQKNIEKLKQLSVTPEEYEAWQERRTAAPTATDEVIADINVENDSPLSDASLLSAFRVEEGSTFDRKAVEDGVSRVYNMGYFESVEYSAKDSPEGKVVSVRARKKDWLDQYIRVGASLEDDFDGNSTYRLGVDYRRTNLGKAGRYLDVQGEVGITPYLRAEWYEPIVDESPWFVAPGAYIGRSPVFIRDAGSDLIAEYIGSQGFGFFSAGRELGRSGEILGGVRAGRGRFTRHIGDPALPQGSYDIGEAFSSFSYDALDAADFPTEGVLARVRYVNSGESLGADSQFNEFTGRVTLPLTAGNNTLLVSVDMSQTYPRRPVNRSFIFGGFLDFSGYQRASLAASSYEIVRTAFYHRFSEYKLPIANFSFFAGASFEYGSLRSDNAALPDRNPLFGGSVFLGLDTPLIPTYIGFGLGEEGNKAIYLTLGRITNDQVE